MAAISRKMTAASLLTDAIEILRQSLFIKLNAGQGPMVIMPFKYTDEKENFLYAWRAFSYGKKIEIFC